MGSVENRIGRAWNRVGGVEVRSPKGAGHQSLGQRPRNYGEGRFSQACDKFVLGVPAANCGRLDEAKARDPERALTERTSGVSQNLEVECSSGILTGRKPRAMPWAVVSAPSGLLGIESARLWVSCLSGSGFGRAEEIESAEAVGIGMVGLRSEAPKGRDTKA